MSYLEPIHDEEETLSLDASCYENYLSDYCKKMASKPQPMPVYPMYTDVSNQQYNMNVPLDPISNIFYSIKKQEMFQQVKKNLKVESSPFKPTFLPRIWPYILST